MRTVPPTALKEIKGGRLNGKSDINPMWRIKALTEQFGPCGIGWKYEILKQWMEEGSKGEIAAFVNINLCYKTPDGTWSEPIPGTGGNMFVANEKNGPYVSDECYKMALTDAISVACKALGFGADTYWEKGSTKYDRPYQQQPTQQQTQRPPQQRQQQPQRQQTQTQAQPQQANFSRFWARVREVKGTPELCHRVAGVESLKGFTEAQLDELLDKVKIVISEQAAV